MREGQILKIHIDGASFESPIECFTEMMKWRTAAFSFSMQDLTAHDEIQTSVELLLMEASRILDEGIG
jgi:hypothetical protein